jgi:hypothetical protein
MTDQPKQRPEKAITVQPTQPAVPAQVIVNHTYTTLSPVRPATMGF